MKIAATLAAVMVATQAAAGGLDATGQSVSFLFREGSALELGFGRAMPDISGNDAALFGGMGTGDIGQDVSLPFVSVKHDLTDRLSFGLIVEKPFVADVAFGPGSLAFAGTLASADVTSATLLLRYKFTDRFSLYGGPRFQSAEANFQLSGTLYGPLSGYTARLSRDSSVGYVIGAAFEIPEYFLRASLTYGSAIDHDLQTTENSLFGRRVSMQTVTIPRSVNLEFQSGIAPKTFVFGGARWVEWSKLNFAPPTLAALTSDPLIRFEDTVTYSLGIGRQLSDNWTGTAALIYEPSTNPRPVPLLPTDGFRGVVLGAIYARDSYELHATFAMTQLGDTAPFATALGTTVSSFSGNTSKAVGFKFVQKF